MYKNAKFVFCLFLLAVGLCLPVQAATLIVDPGTPGAYDTVSSAVAAAAAGDCIEIAAYTYMENVTVTKTLVFVGVPDPLTGEYPVIDGDGALYALGFDRVAADCSFINVTGADIGLLADSGSELITLTGVNAYGNAIAGIFADSVGDVTIAECSADNNAYLGVIVVPTAAEIVVPMDGGLDAYAPAVNPDEFSDGVAGILLSVGPDTGMDTALTPLPETGTVLISDVSTNGNGVIGCAAMAFSETELTVTDFSASENGGYDTGSPLELLKSGLTVVAAHNSTAALTGITSSDNGGCGVMALGDIVTATSVTAENNANLGIAVIDFRLLDVLNDIGILPDITGGLSTPDAAFETAFSGITASVADATAVSEDEFVLGEEYIIFTEDVIADGPDAVFTSIDVNNNGYAGIGVIAPYIIASDISADENGVSTTAIAGTLTGAGLVGASFVGEYTGMTAADNGGAGMATASLVLEIGDSSFTRNGEYAFSDIHGPLFQTGLLTVSLVNNFSGVHSDNNAGSGILMTSVITECDGCTASNNDYGGIVAADPLSLGIAALLVHFGTDFISETDDLSEEERFYLESLSSQTMQDVMTCYGTTGAFVPSAVAETGMDGALDETEISPLIELLHQYLAISGCSITGSAAEDNGLFGLVAVYPNVATDGFIADSNGYDGGSVLEAIAGTGIISIYLTGDFVDTSASENTGAGIVTIGVVSEYTGVTADDNGYAGIVTIDPLTLAAAVIGYFVILDDTGAEVSVTSDMADLDMHSDIAGSDVMQEIVATYYTGTAPVGTGMDAVTIPEGGMEILLDHIELYFENAGVYATDVSASGNGYPGFVAIGPNIRMDGVTADGNGALNDDESSILALAAGSGIIGLSIVGDYADVAANENTGAGIAAAGVVTEMTACEADGNGVGLVSLFIAGDYTGVGADENAVSGIILGGINGTLTSSSADGNAGPGIVVVDPVAAVVMYLIPVSGSDSMDTTYGYDEDGVSPEMLALLSQLSGSTDTTASFDSTGDDTAWTLIEWALAHISSYEGDISSLNETEIIDLVLMHYLTGAGLSVSDVTAEDNGWHGVVVLSPSITIEGVEAYGNGYHGVSVISPWKAVDATGFVHPAEPVGADRLNVFDISAENNDGAGLSVSGANGGDIALVYGSGNDVGMIFGDSDNLLVSDSVFDTNMIASVFCGGNQLNSLIPTGVFLSDEILNDTTGSCDNTFTNIGVDGGIVVLPSSTGNVFIGTFFDEAALIGADISGDGPFVLYSITGSWAPALPEIALPQRMGGCGIGVVGVGGFNTTVNITYDYSYGFPPITGAGLYTQWAVNESTPWEDWEFNEIVNDADAMTLGTMMVSLTSSSDDTFGVFTDYLSVAPIWVEQPGGDNPGLIVTGGPASGAGTSGQTGTESGSGDTAGTDATPSPVPTADPGEGDGADPTATVTPAPSGGSDSTGMPADAGASGSSGFLPWVVLLVVLVVIAGAVYFMKYQQK